jgi:hypothetical protein
MLSFGLAYALLGYLALLFLLHLRVKFLYSTTS